MIWLSAGLDTNLDQSYKIKYILTLPPPPPFLRLEHQRILYNGIFQEKTVQRRSKQNNELPFTGLNGRVVSVLTSDKHLHDRIVSQIWVHTVRAHRTSLTPPLFLLMCLCQAMKVSCHLNMYFSGMYFSGIYLPLSAIVLLDFGTVPTVWNVLFSFFYH